MIYSKAQVSGRARLAARHGLAEGQAQVGQAGAARGHRQMRAAAARQRRQVQPHVVQARLRAQETTLRGWSLGLYRAHEKRSRPSADWHAALGMPAKLPSNKQIISETGAGDLRVRSRRQCKLSMRTMRSIYMQGIGRALAGSPARRAAAPRAPPAAARLPRRTALPPRSPAGSAAVSAS